MMLEDKDRQFIQRRRKLLHFWPYACTALLMMLSALVTTFFLKLPLMINPYAVIEQVGNDALPQSSLELLAMMMPVTMLALFVVMCFFIILMFAVVSREKRYIRMLEKQ